MPQFSNDIEQYSEEVQEIMGRIPGRVTRWGLSMIFGIFFLLILGACIFKYPEVISAPVMITTKQPPVSLIARISGKIVRIFEQDGAMVKKGDPVALLENTANYEHICRVKALVLSGFVNKIDKHTPSLTELELGSLQDDYEQLRKTTDNYIHFLKLSFIPTKITLLQKQILKQEEYYQKLLLQKKYQEKELMLSRKGFQRDSQLYHIDPPAISAFDYEKTEQAFVQKQSAFIGFTASMKNVESTILQMKKDIVELKMDQEKEEWEYKSALNESFRLFSAQLKQWEENYLLVSPISGKVSFSNYWSENQHITSGHRLASVVPGDSEGIIGKAKVPVTGFGKVEVGQQVNIKLNGFPYMEFGMLKGRIKSISMVPDESGYSVDIEITSGMVSSYKEQLKFIQEMDGTAEIITRNVQAIYRFINPLKALADRGL
jgi:multidrug resistance efflux pump